MVSQKQFQLTWIICVALTTGWIEATPAPEPYYGVSIGKLSDLQGIGLSGDVYIVNSSCLQVINFTYAGTAPDLFFWLDKSPAGLTSSGLKLSTFEHGISPLGKFTDARVVLTISENFNISEYRSFGLWSHSYKNAFGFVQIPKNIDIPKAHYLEDNIKGIRYSVGCGAILILDRRTVKILGFTFDGAFGPNGFFLVGKGKSPKATHGTIVPVRYKDTPNNIQPLDRKYTGDSDIILDLPADYDIYHIDYISVYSKLYRADYGHVNVRNISDRIPPYVPVQQKYDQMVERIKKPWENVILWGHERRTNFTFQLGPPGGKRGYEAMNMAKPAKSVWYVNGYLAPEIWLLTNRTYTFIIEGGNDPKSELFDNHMYISNELLDSHGKLNREPNPKAVLAGLDTQGKPIVGSNGRLCRWISRLDSVDPDAYDDFRQYKRTLKLDCSPGQSGVYQFTPRTPGEAFYQSFEHPNMGGRITVSDEIENKIEDFKEEPYRYEDYMQYQSDQAKMLKENRHSTSSANSPYCSLAVTLLSLLALWQWFS